MKNYDFTAVFEECIEGGYMAYIAEIPGINTQGETLDEAKKNLKESFNLMMSIRKEEELNREHSGHTIREKFTAA